MNPYRGRKIMKKRIARHAIQAITALLFLTFFAGGCALRVEKANYTVIRQDKNFELRDYPSQIVAETEVSGTIEDAGNRAFRPLFNYISGENRSQEKISMTSPVTQEASSEKIAMTAPVAQQSTADGWMVSFMMPQSYTMDTLPTPNDPKVQVREIPQRRMACVTYSGTWSEKRYLRNLQDLEAWIAENGFTVLGSAVWARYNPPFTPWFLRRNEILIPVDSEGK
jgi:effector-binding domain-containing protein